MKFKIRQIIITLLCCNLISCYYIPPPPANTLPSELLELDSTNPSYQSSIDLDPSYLAYFSLNFEYGIWSQYTPISQIKSIGPVANSDCAILNYVVNSENTQTFFYYVCFDEITQQVRHIVQFICENQEYQQELAIIGNQYEGRWMYFHLASLPTEKIFFVSLMIADGSQYTFQAYNHQFPFSIGYNDIYYGDSVIVTNANFKDIKNLMSFRGRVMLYKIVKNADLSSMHTTQQQISQLAASYDIYLYPSCKSSVASNGLTTNLQSIIEITQSNKMQQAYQAFGWFKLQNTIVANTEYQIIGITSSYKQIGYEQFFSKISTNLRYFQTFKGVQEIHFHTYSITLPNFNIGSVKDIDDIISLSFSVQEWHFIAIYFNENQNNLKLKIYHDPLLIEKSYIVSQFTNYELKLSIGTQLNSNTLEISEVLLQNCALSETDVVCHYKCETCFGPSDVECTSCDSNDHRMLRYNQCVCQLGYYLYSSTQTCESNIELGLELIERYDIIEDETLCPIGYNKYLDNCIKCPGVKTHYGISCTECYKLDNYYVVDWITTPKCSSYYHPYQDNIDYSFVKSMTTSYVYLIKDAELIMCEYCGDICSSITIICQPYQITHMDSLAYVYCQADYIFFNNLCVKQIQLPWEFTQIQPLQNCEYTQYAYCEKCIDQKKYYRSLRNPLNCIPCIILNCEYCMEYSLSDKTINSYTNTKPFIYDDDIIIACALCKDGYSFNQQTNECEYIALTSPCERQLIDYNDKIVCLITSQQFPVGNAIQYSQCNVFITNCNQCIIDGVQIYCIICNDGYKVDQSSFQCIKCGFTNYKTCVDIDYNINDSYIIGFQSFYYYLVGQLYQLSYSYFASEVALSCYSGQEVYEGLCIDNCDTSGNCNQCSIIDYDLWYTCTKCDASRNGYLVQQIQELSFSTYNSCIECNFLCNFCELPSQKCVFKEQVEQYTYIDNQYGVVHFCEQNAKCQKELIKNYEVNCSNRDDLFKLILMSNEIDLRYDKDNIKYQQYSDIIATRKFTYNFLIVEDLTCPITDYDNLRYEFQSFLTSSYLEEFQYIFRSLNYNQIRYKLTETIFYSVVTLIQFDGLTIMISPKYQLIKNDYTQSKNTNYFFNNSIFQGNCQTCIIYLKLGNLQNITFNNIIFKDLSISNQVIVQFTQPSIQLATVSLHNVTFQNCTFEQSSFLYYHDQLTINLDYVQFINCTFNQFSFFTTILAQQSIDIQISNLEISQTLINNSNLFEFSPYSNVFISDVSITNCIIQESILFKIRNSLTLHKLNITQNSIYNTYIVLLDLLIYIPQLQFSFYDITFQENYFEEVKIMTFYFKEDQKVYIDLNNINHIDQTHTNESNSNILYSFKSFYSKANTQSSQISDLFSISINQFAFRQPTQPYISFWKECNTNNALTNLFSIQGFTSIQIENCLFYQLQMIDKLIFNINSESVESYQKFLIQNVTFQQNLLVKQSEGISMGFIQISLKLDIPIVLKQIIFIENFINFYVQDTYLAPATFLVITAYDSQIELQEIYMKSNYLSNTTSTYFSINGRNVFFTNITSINTNYKDLTKNVHFDQSVNQRIFEQMVQQHFNIQSNPGLGSISSQSLTIADSQFMNGRAYSTNIFYIIGKQNCTFTMKNVVITNQTSNLDINPQIYGSFYINSQSSVLIMDINNITLDSLTNRMESAFLYIAASEYQNSVSMKNLIIRDVYSLKSALINLDQSNSYSTSNNILIQNVNVVNDQNKMYLFLQKLREITNTYPNNGFIYINKGNSTLTNITISGYFPSSFLQIVNGERLILRNIIFKDISILQALLNIQIKNYFQMHQCYFGNIQQTSIHNSTSFPKIQTLTHYDLSGYQDCSLIIRQDLQQIYDDNLEKETLFYKDQLLMAIQQIVNGLITLSIENEVTIEISQSEFTNLTSESTIFYFDAKSVNQILFQKCQFTNNTIINGSISIISEDYNTILTIKESLFQKNQCNNGCSIYAVNITLNLKNSQFLSNYASELGAGIYLKSDQNLKISQLTFLNNQAQRGGAMYLIGTSLTKENIENLIMSNNTVIEVYEQPSSLSAKINFIDIPSEYYSNGELNISHPKQFSFIKLPSQQQLKDYKLFNQLTNSYDQTNFNLQFIGLNFQHEKILDLANTQCQVSKNIINLTTYEILKPQNPTLTIEFDTVTNSYNFENVTLVFDPYSKEDQALQLSIKCDSIKNANYQYLLNVRTFPCQMGEYYYSEGCFMCDYEKGYYSVTSNSSKCYQADINKVKSNTANMLQIQPGYWRANYHTNDIVSCGAMQQYCLGGWKVDHDLCFTGHIGALCEECDIYNKYGNGQFFKGTSHNCLLCKESWGPIISLVLLSAWTFFSISLTVRSMKLANLQYRSLILGQKHFAIIAKYHQDLAGCLIKMLSNQLLVLAAVYQFQQGISFNLFWIEDIASPSLSASFNFDCWLSQQTIIDILYLRTFLILLIPFAYLNLFIWGYLLYIIYKKEKYESSTIHIVIVYLFVVTQPDIIKYNGALITSRNISGEDWVQANVSYFYNTVTHHKWMLCAILPILLTWCALIPFYFATNLYWNRAKLRYTSFRAKWSYLYNEYVPKRYFWEIVKVLQREVQILILTLFFDNISIKVYLLFLIQFFYLLTITKMQPFNSEQLNKLEIESVQKCILILIFGLTAWSTSTTNLEAIHIISYSLLLFTTIVHVAPFIYNILKIYLKKYEENLDALINIIQNKPILRRFFSGYLGSIIRNKDRKKVVKERFGKIKQYLKTRAKSIKLLEKSLDPYQEENKQVVGVDQMLSPHNQIFKSNSSFINSQRKMLSEVQ